MRRYGWKRVGMGHWETTVSHGGQLFAFEAWRAGLMRRWTLAVYPRPFEKAILAVDLKPDRVHYKALRWVAEQIAGRTRSRHFDAEVRVIFESMYHKSLKFQANKTA